jgi:acyl-CoA reductase-like NAD-dependent aldehyde dehydrogenase
VLARLGELQQGDAPTADDAALVAGRCGVADADHNQAAIEAAHAARLQAAAVPLDERRRLAAEVRAALARAADEMTELLVAEGHPRRLAAWEIGSMLEGSAPETTEWCFRQLRQELRAGRRRILILRKPDGVVCLNPPQNAASANASLGVAVLLAGNTLVVKAPRTAPLSTMFLFVELVAPLLARHGFPAGALNVVCASSKPTLEAWIESPLVDDVMFFGDSGVGLEIGVRCTQKGKKPVLELAGNDGFVVWRDADLDRAAEALCECFYGSAQICMVPKYAIAHPAIADELCRRVVARAADLRPGYPDDPDTVLSPVLKLRAFEEFLADARAGGATVLTGGRRMDVHGQITEDGVFAEPTVVRVEGLESARELRCVRDETFFPLLPIVVPEPSSDNALLRTVIDFVEANAYGLRNSLWTADEGVIESFVATLTNGGLLKVNESHLGMAPYLAGHGGTGLTGGPHGELHYPMLRTTHLQGVSIGAAG